jgi:hypothetical protein
MYHSLQHPELAAGLARERAQQARAARQLKAELAQESRPAGCQIRPPNPTTTAIRARPTQATDSTRWAARPALPAAPSALNRATPSA